MWRFGRFLSCGIALLAAAGPSAAAEIALGVRDVSVISSTQGDNRILFRLPDLGLPANSLLLRATLEFTLNSVPTALEEQIQVHPVTTAWAAGAVTWTSGWEKPGGDIDVDLYSRVDIDLSRGRQQVGIDLTGLLREQFEEGMFADGFLVTVPPYVGEGIPATALARYLSIGSATMHVSYREVSAPPPSKRL